MTTAGGSRIRVRLNGRGYSDNSLAVNFQAVINGVAYPMSGGVSVGGYGAAFSGQCASDQLEAATYTVTLQAAVTYSSMRIYAATFPGSEGIWVSLEEVL
jgi:hypothetical protein